MNKTFLFIVVLAIVLRFYQLGQNPPSLDWDEASLGYNAYSILKTGADEYGNWFPAVIRSFDDYKPPLYTYLTIPSVWMFGLTEFAVRLPSAIFGVLTVVVAYYLVKELFGKRGTTQNSTRNHADQFALLASFLLAISPWHLQFSRVAFEANIGLFFFVLGTFLFLKGLGKPTWFLFSFLVFTLCLYAYHSVRLVLPAFLFGLFLYYGKQLLLGKLYVLAGILLAAMLLFPLIATFLGGGGGSSRFSSVTILTPTGTLDRSIAQLAFDREQGNILGEIFHNRRVVYALATIKGYLDHWNFDFLFLRGDGIKRHHAADIGMLYLFELPFLFVGIYSLLRIEGWGRFVVFWWFLVAPLASAITSGTPHPVRALLYIPTYQVFTAIGILTALMYVSSIKYQVLRIKVKNVILLFAFLLITFNILYYLHQYYVHTPREYSQGWQYGFKELISVVSQIEGRYDKILVTYKYDQPYIFFLFHNRTDPAWYQGHWDYRGDGTIERARRLFGKYEFRNIDWGSDQKLQRTLVVGSPTEIPDNANILREIHFLDGTVAFRIAET